MSLCSRFTLLALIVSSALSTHSFAQNFDANTQITIESVSPSSRPSQAEKEDDEIEPRFIRKRIKDLPAAQQLEQLKLLRSQAPFTTLSTRKKEDDLNEIVEVPNPKAGQKKTDGPKTKWELSATSARSYDSNIGKARVNSLSDQISAFGALARVKAPMDDKRYIVVVGTVSSLRYSTYNTRDIDALGFSTAYGYLFHSQKFYPGINVSTTHTIQIGHEVQAVFGTGFEPWSGTRNTPFVSYTIDSIPLARATCGTGDAYYCLAATVKFTYQENMLTAAFQDNSALKIESTITWITPKPGVVLTLSGSALPRKFHGVPGGRNDVVYDISPGFEWTISDNAVLSASYKYITATSSVEAFNWSGYVTGPQFKLKKTF